MSVKIIAHNILDQVMKWLDQLMLLQQMPNSFIRLCCRYR